MPCHVVALIRIWQNHETITTFFAATNSIGVLITQCHRSITEHIPFHIKGLSWACCIWRTHCCAIVGISVELWITQASPMEIHITSINVGRHSANGRNPRQISTVQGCPYRTCRRVMKMTPGRLWPDLILERNSSGIDATNGVIFQQRSSIGWNSSAFVLKEMDRTSSLTHRTESCWAFLAQGKSEPFLWWNTNQWGNDFERFGDSERRNTDLDHSCQWTITSFSVI
jgi:hypothetical protein